MSKPQLCGYCEKACGSDCCSDCHAHLTLEWVHRQALRMAKVYGTADGTAKIPPHVLKLVEDAAQAKNRLTLAKQAVEASLSVKVKGRAW